MELIEATQANNLGRVQQLIRQRVDLNARDDDGETALGNAAAEGYEEIGLALIEAGADINLRDRYNNTPLMRAISSNREDFVILLLEQDGVDLNGALISAAVGPNVEILNLILGEGADPNKEELDNTPLIASVGNEVEMVQALLDAGANINQKTTYLGETALMHAATILKARAVLRLLLSRPDVDLDVQDKNGETALIKAARSGTSFRPIVDSLITAGADPTITTNEGKKASDVASGGYIKNDLLQYEADYAVNMANIKKENVKRAMLQKRMTTGVNFPSALQLPQKQLPKNIFTRAAYDELCSQLNTNNTRPQLQELARTLGITPSNKSKAALCQAIATTLGL